MDITRFDALARKAKRRGLVMTIPRLKLRTSSPFLNPRILEIFLRSQSLDFKIAKQSGIPVVASVSV